MNPYEAAQTALCNQINERFQSILTQLKEASNCIGSAECSALLDDIISDAQAAQVANDRLACDEVL